MIYADPRDRGRYHGPLVCRAAMSRQPISQPRVQPFAARRASTSRPAPSSAALARSRDRLLGRGDIAAVGAVVGRPAMVELVDHLGFVERHVARRGRGAAALRSNGGASRPPPSAIAAWRGGRPRPASRRRRGRSPPRELGGGAEQAAVVGHVEHTPDETRRPTGCRPRPCSRRSAPARGRRSSRSVRRRRGSGRLARSWCSG